ncbi:MAG: TatD DNase family protein [Verrucomicrobiota bacterium]|jgi:TatD DNase family protein
MTAMRLYDAHNHLQDERFNTPHDLLLAACSKAGIEKMVVNGSCESDWPAVLDLARQYPAVVPSFGYHPWHLHECTGQWQENLAKCLDAIPSAVGEIGLDRWKQGLDWLPQEEAFVIQLRMAAQRRLPISIHCLQAWGPLLDVLRSEPPLPAGFLLHSYGGPPEMIQPLAKLGAYFSFPGFFAQDRKSRQRETFRHVPRDRLLIETDAPDQSLPASLATHPLTDGAGNALNHPANLAATYQFLATFLGEPQLAERVEANFLRLFGGVLKSSPG